MVRSMTARARRAFGSFGRHASARAARRGVGLIALAVAGSASANLPQSWNGYRWARTGNLSISVGNNLSAAWQPYLTTAASQWSAHPIIDMNVVAGRSAPSTCRPVYGGVQACNASYGANGWLGYAQVWLSGGFIVQATVKMNEYYFAMAKYNTPAWRAATMCQEVGHTLGLDHTNIVRTDPNTGSCMDYTRDPSGTKGTNGTLANTAPNAVDFAALSGIYANLDSSQLSSTQADTLISMGYSVNGDEMHEIRSLVPEPATWAMMIIGFGAIGAAARRRQVAALA